MIRASPVQGRRLVHNPIPGYVARLELLLISIRIIIMSKIVPIDMVTLLLEKKRYTENCYKKAWP
jgi:hypothetical protein